MAIVLSAVLLPGVSVRDSWPEVRAEQVLVLGAGVWLVWMWWTAGRPLRPAPLDLLFLGVGLSVAASTIYAPLALDSEFSPRDLYEVAKVGMYWVLFRFGWEGARPAEESAARGVVWALLAGGTLAGLFGLAQYYNWLDVNAWATPAWAPAHHLRTLAEDARAVGTIGNPNYFGMLSALVVLAAVAWLVSGATGIDRVLCVTAAGGGALGLVTSASRGATLAFVAGMAVLWVALLVRRRGARWVWGETWRRMLFATGGVALALVLAIGLVEAAPRGRTDYLTRMTGAAGTDNDGSLALRLERWRSALPWTRTESGAKLEPGTVLTFIENGSLEAGGGHADGFRTIPGTRYELTDADARFGERSARFLGNPREPDERAAIFQQRYLGRTDGMPMTASLWVKLSGPVSGDLSLWTNVYYADGTRSDPHSRPLVDTSRIGEWQQLVASIRPDPDRTVTFVGVYLMGENFRGEALVDGFQLVNGDAPADFATLSVAPPSVGAQDTGAILQESPVFGGGPAKAETTGTLDNEYLTIAGRYGLLGLALYLTLWGAVAATAWRGVRRTAGGAATALCLTVLTTIAGFLVFNLVAGSFLHLQLMGLFWPLAGVAAACAVGRRSTTAVTARDR
ncbi:MAG: O-antigen ligase family protein [Dehalococcoidia bacterium]